MNFGEFSFFPRTPVNSRIAPARSVKAAGEAVHIAGYYALERRGEPESDPEVLGPGLYRILDTDFRESHHSRKLVCKLQLSSVVGPRSGWPFPG